MSSKADRKKVNGNGRAGKSGNAAIPGKGTQIIGERLRKLRLAKGWSIREASRRANLSHSFLTLVEDGETEIAVSRLLNLAETYGVFVTEILSDVHDRHPEFQRSGEELAVPFGSDSVKLEFLSGPAWQTQLFRLTLEGGAELTNLNHHGDEALHCVLGRITVTIATQSFDLQKGDTVIVPEFTDHAYYNKHRSRAVIIGSVARVNTDNASDLSDANGRVQP
jgi:transcriptional regulator with XRE-family HTH domain